MPAWARDDARRVAERGVQALARNRRVVSAVTVAGIGPSSTRVTDLSRVVQAASVAATDNLRETPVLPVPLTGR